MREIALKRDQDVTTIATRLKSARIEMGWSQDVLAKKSGVSQGTVGNIEAGIRRSYGSLPRIAEALGVRNNWLRDGELPKYDGSIKSIVVGECQSVAQIVIDVDEAGVARMSATYRGEFDCDFPARGDAAIFRDIPDLLANLREKIDEKLL